VDNRIAQCTRDVGNAQAQCWANLDKYLMVKVVPWVPYYLQRIYRITSARVEDYSLDQFTRMPALDQIALKVSAIRGDT
jgi:hypothetical protein